MSKSLSVSSSKIYYGMASRYVKPSFVESSTILNEAFDLRDRTPSEKFVSFNLLNKSDENSMFHESIHFLKITPKENGAIIILDIKEALEEVNDEIENIIEFALQNLSISSIRTGITELRRLTLYCLFASFFNSGSLSCVS